MSFKPFLKILPLPHHAPVPAPPPPTLYSLTMDLIGSQASEIVHRRFKLWGSLVKFFAEE